MDVRCPQCHTVYEVDEINAYSAAITLQCSQCNLVFQLDASAKFIEENQRRWMLRSQASGDILYFNTFDILHRWIMDRTVSGEDTISRTGNKWTPLMTIGEFAPIFQTVESIARIAQTQSSAPADVPKPSVPKPSPQTTENIATQIIPAPKPPQEKSHTLPYGAPAIAKNTSPKPTPSKPTPPKPRIVASPRPNLPQVIASPSHPTGQHRAELRPQPEENWSFGTALPDTSLQESEEEQTITWAPHDPFSVETTHTTHRPRRRFAACTAIALILIAAGATAYLYADDLQTWWKSTSTPDNVVTLGNLAAPQPQPAATPEPAPNANNQPDSPTQRESTRQIHYALAAADAHQKSQTPPHSEPETSETPETTKKRHDLPSLLTTGQHALERGNPERARRLFHQATQLDPQNAEAITGLGWSLLALGNHDSAIAQFRRAKHRDPSFGGSYIGLGRAERDRGNLQEALKAYEEYLNRFPDGPQISIARFQSEQLKRQLNP